MLRVRDIASGQVRPGGRSIPRGRGGMEELVGGADGCAEKPFKGSVRFWKFGRGAG